jgi:hypothetical protein
MPNVHLKRSAVLAGLVSVAVVGVMMFTPAAAMAAHGTQPGNLVLTPASGPSTTAATWSTTTPCPVGQQNQAILEAYDTTGAAQHMSNPVLPGSVAIPAKPMLGTMGALEGTLLLSGTAPVTFEFVVNCQAAVTDLNPTQSIFVTFAADGSYTTSATPPAGPAATTTTVSASSSSVATGGTDTFTATVTSASGVPAGTVAFSDGATSLGSFPLVNGSASVQDTTSLTGAGTTHTITAVFTPTTATAFASSQGTTNVLVTGGLIQSETINVSIPASQGALVLTVNNATPVSMGTAILSADFKTFSATGTLNDVTVSDQRNQTVPGWHVTGKVGNFVGTTNPANTLGGQYLGWMPAVKTQNTAGDVLAGAAVTPNSPGLTTESPLGSAAVGKGLNTSVFNAALNLAAPANTQPDSYSATMTITLYVAP